MRALASDLAYLEAWSCAVTGAALTWPASETSVLRFIAHYLWDEEERAKNPEHGMPESVDSALRAEGRLAGSLIEPLQNRAWLGPLLVAALLGGRSKTRHHLAAVHAGVRRAKNPCSRQHDAATQIEPDSGIEGGKTLVARETSQCLAMTRTSHLDHVFTEPERQIADSVNIVASHGCFALGYQAIMQFLVDR